MLLLSLLAVASLNIAWTTCQGCYAGCRTCLSGDPYTCTSCEEGYFLEETFCIKCLQQCTGCWGETICYSCQDGYFLMGITCAHCEPECRTCNPEMTCTSCISGYYFSNDTCSPCPIACSSCNSRDNCTSCKVGYYYSDGVCLSCPELCESCTHLLQCTECKNGYYISATDIGGQDCHPCLNVCSSCKSVDHCLSCQRGYHLSDGVCSSCSDSCASCTSLNKCTDCKDGYYISVTDIGGQYCHPCLNVCSSCKSIDHCLSCQRGFHLSDGVCSSCPKSCASCTTLNHCTECKDGYYISEAEIGIRNCRPCSVGCVAGQCNKTSGICQCREHFTTKKCDTCVDGRSGEDCLKNCPENCHLENCDNNSRSCLDGCVDGFSGNLCCLEGPGCLTCISEHLCSECIPGKHGTFCQKDCSEECENSLCYKDTGACHAVRNPEIEGNYAGTIGGGLAATVVAVVAVFVMVIFCRRRTIRYKQSESQAIGDAQLEAAEIQPNENEIDTRYQNAAYQYLKYEETEYHIYAALQDEVPGDVSTNL